MQLKWLSSTPYRTSQSKAGTNLPNKFFGGLPSKDHIIRGGSLCIWSLMSAIQMMDRNDLLIPADQAAEIETLLIQHLLHYQGIWQYYNSKGVKRWKIRPKHHDLEHIAKITKKTLINPRLTACWQDESFLGQVKKVATKCHSSTVLLRVFQRIILNLSVRWKNSRVRQGS